MWKREKRPHHDSHTLKNNPVYHIFYSKWDHNLLNEHNSVLKKNKNKRKKTRQTQQNVRFQKCFLFIIGQEGPHSVGCFKGTVGVFWSGVECSTCQMWMLLWFVKGYIFSHFRATMISWHDSVFLLLGCYLNSKNVLFWQNLCLCPSLELIFTKTEFGSLIQ